MRFQHELGVIIINGSVENQSWYKLNVLWFEILDARAW